MFHNLKDTCPVCLEVQTFLVEHPAECKHKLCVQCLKTLFWGSEINIDAGDYGFVTLCTCIRCSNNDPCRAELHKWELNYPEQYERYLIAGFELERQLEYNDIEDVANRHLCPVCRQDVRNAPNNSWNMW